MNVLLIVGWFNSYGTTGKTGIFHYEFALALKKYSNYKVAIYFPFDSVIKKSCYIERTDDNIYIFRSPLEKNKIKRLGNYIKACRTIKEYFDFDIIHANNADSSGKVAFLLSKLMKIPYCITEHTPIEMMSNDSIIYRIKNHFIYKASSSNACVSNDLNNKLSSYYNDINFVTIYNGIEKPLDTIKGNMIIDNSFINCCIVASFYDKNIKGFQYLLPALSKYNNLNDEKIFLHICGDGVFKEYYEKMAIDLGINETTKFYGMCSKIEVYSIIKEMDFCISSSIYESAGVFIEESFLMGKPMIITKSGGGESLANSKTAIIVERGEIDSLYNGLVKMSNSFKDFDRDYISKYAYENFYIKNIVAQYCDVYKKMI